MYTKLQKKLCTSYLTRFWSLGMWNSRCLISCSKNDHLSQLMRLWYLSHRRPAKAQARLRIRAVSPEPLLFAYIKYGSILRVRPKIRHLAPLDGCTCAFEKMSLRRPKSVIISWDGSFAFVMNCCILKFYKQVREGETLKHCRGSFQFCNARKWYFWGV